MGSGNPINTPTGNAPQGSPITQPILGTQSGFRKLPEEPIDRSVKGVSVTSGQDYLTNVPQDSSSAAQSTSGTASLAGDSEEPRNPYMNYNPTAYSGDYAGIKAPTVLGLTGQMGEALANYQLNVQKDAVKNRAGTTFTNPSGGPVTVHEGLFGGLVVTGNTMGVPQQVYFDAYKDAQKQVTDTALDSLTTGYEEAAGISVSQEPKVVPTPQVDTSTIAGIQQASAPTDYKSLSGNTYTGQAAVNKQRADEEAQRQTGRTNVSAVTDSSGNAVRSSSGVVTSNEPSGGGK